MKNMLILMWTITFGLMVIVDMNNKAIQAHLSIGNLDIAGKLVEGNWIFMASLAVMALTTITATAFAVRKLLA